MRTALNEAVLYGICDLGYLSREEALPTSRLLLEGRAGILQLRAKGIDPASLTDLAIDLRKLCQEFEVPFIVNDHLRLAKESGAHGLHLGQDDGSIEEARQIFPPNFIIGRSTHSIPQAQRALSEKADYIGFGPLFPTPTKLGRPGIGLEDVAEMQRTVGETIPAFCIGGITPENLEIVCSAGARRVVVVSALLSSPDPAATCAEVIEIINKS